MILDEIAAAVKSQLAQQAASGVRIVEQDDVPDTGPVRGGVWLQIPEVTSIFVDLKGSTGLNARLGAEAAAHAYNYFNRAVAVILNGFQARYVDVQGDGLFGLFSGRGSRFLAAACAITMKTQVETVVAERFRRDVRANWELRAGIGVDRGKLLVRQLGLRGTDMNEVWAGDAREHGGQTERSGRPQRGGGVGEGVLKLPTEREDQTASTPVDATDTTAEGDWTCLRSSPSISGKALLPLQTWGWTSIKFTGCAGPGARRTARSSARR